MNLKRSLLVFFVFAGAMRLVAQPVVTASDMFQPGDARIDFIADTTGVDYGTGGANKTWDYSNLQRISSSPDSIITSFVAASSTPYYSDFPSSTLATQAASGTYSYESWNSSTSTATLVGMVAQSSGFTLVETYNKPMLLASYPINSTYKVTSDFSATYVAGGVTIYRNGTVSISADGYGTVKLPRHTYSNALRLHQLSVSTDSSSFGGSVTAIKEVGDGYAFLVPGIKAPILTVSHNEQYYNGSDQGGAKTVLYYDRAKTEIASTGNLIKSSLQIYPNPMHDVCTLAVQSDENLPADIYVTNMLGQVVKTYSNMRVRQGANTFTVDMSDFGKGLYTVRLDAGMQSVSQKILVQ